MPIIGSQEPLTVRVAGRLVASDNATAAVRLLGRSPTPAWLVGGFLRDLALERPYRDIDVVVRADPETVARALAAPTQGHVVPLDRERGVFRVVFDDGTTLDISALRGEGIAADLAERDFTINAIAIALSDSPEDPVDPFGGLEDLRRARLRLVSPRAFRDDGLRILRAARLGSELDFGLDPALTAQARADLACLAGAAPDRRRDEIVRLLATDRAAAGLRTLDRMGALVLLFPLLARARGVTQPPEHYYDVFEHSIETVGALDALMGAEPPPGRAAASLRSLFWRWLDPIAALRAYFEEEPVPGRSRLALTKLAALLHDIAKPETKAPDETGRIRFFGHADRGAAETAVIAEGLRFANRETAFLRTVVAEHLRPLQTGNGGPPTDRAVARYFRDLGDAALATLVLSLADHMAARGPRIEHREFGRHVAYLGYLADRRRVLGTMTPREQLLTGDDLMRDLGLAPGPLIGRLLRAVDESRAAGEVRTREEAMDIVRQALTPER
ncbi:MAG: HD domain-containing protein [Dehalococcoidia bacterium]|nr:HD domain-containing protein [Dehalococcoidia bacterium]